MSGKSELTESVFPAPKPMSFLSQLFRIGPISMFILSQLPLKNSSLYYLLTYQIPSIDTLHVDPETLQLLLPLLRLLLLFL